MSVNYFAPSSEDYDLTSENDVKKLFTEYQPNIVLHLAGKVGGIGANKEKPGDFFYDNIMINTNVIEACRIYDVKKIICFL